MADDAIRRARRHEAAGQIDQALEAYRELTPDSPAYPEARIRIIGIALMRGRLDEAESEARAFAAQKPQMPEPHATLGQVLRLSFRHDDAIAALKKAAELAPRTAGYRMLLNDARRARYWSPDADLYQGLRAHIAGGPAGPSTRYRLFHLEFLGLLSPDLQRWLTSGDENDELPEPLRVSLDERFEGRFSKALADAVAAWKGAREAGSPYAPTGARVGLADGTSVEGELEDTDATVGGALEAIDGDEYAVLPFGELASVEFGPMDAYVRARVTPRAGRTRQLEVPALYFLTEGCRRPDVREGRLTLWRYITDELRVGLGLRDFQLRSKKGTSLLGIDRVKRIEFL